MRRVGSDKNVRTEVLIHQRAVAGQNDATFTHFLAGLDGVAIEAVAVEDGDTAQTEDQRRRARG